MSKLLRYSVDMFVDKAIVRGLIGLIIALLLLFFSTSYPERSLDLGPKHGLEHSSVGDYQWLPAETTLSFQSPEIASGLIIKQRLLAGSRLEDSRDLTIRSGQTISVFEIEGGQAPRLYSYLLPMEGHYLEVHYSIAALPTDGCDDRSLGMALFSMDVNQIQHPYWLDLRTIILGLVPPFLLLVGGKSSFLLLAFIIAVYLREPLYLLNPRFWAEEGQIYFSYAYTNPWYISLFSPHLGYFSLVNNLATTLSAHVFPIWSSSSVTTFIALCIQITPAIIVIYGRSSLWNTLSKKIVVLILLLLAPIPQELWINTISSQFHLCLASSLLLFEQNDKIKPIKSYFHRLLILLAGLTGVVSCILTPIFIWKSFIYRNKENIIQAILLVICTGIQVVMLGYSMYYSDLKYSRLGSLNISTILATLETKTFLLPLLGEDYTNQFADFVRSAWLETNNLIASYFVIILIMILIIYIFWGVETKLRYLFLASYLILSVIPIIISVGTDKTALIGGFYSYRYFYVPTILLQLTLMYNVFYHAKTYALRSIVCGVLLSVMLVTSTITYPKSNLVGQQWPTWEVEVLKWQADSSYKPLIWPSTWDLELTSRNGEVEQE